MELIRLRMRIEAIEKAMGIAPAVVAPAPVIETPVEVPVAVEVPAEAPEPVAEEAPIAKE